MTESEYRKLQEEVNEAARNAERAQGAFDQLMEQLAEEFGCSSLKEARKKLARLQAEEEKASAEFEQALQEYRDKWHAGDAA